MANNRRLELEDGLAAQGEWLAQQLQENRRFRHLRRLVDYLYRYESIYEDSLARSKKWMSSELIAADDEIDGLWARYRSTPATFRAPSKNSRIEIGPLMDRVPLREAQLAGIVIRLIERDEFDRLRLCPNCGKWFFAARRLDKRSCSDGCRKAAYEKTPGRKEQNRKRQAEYYERNFKSYRKDGGKRYGKRR